MFDPDDYDVAGKGQRAPAMQLSVGATHAIFFQDDPTECGRVFVTEFGGGTIEHWALRPSYRAPGMSERIVILAISRDDDLQDLARFIAEVPGTEYIEARCVRRVPPRLSG
jgi:hypothetical protein